MGASVAPVGAIQAFAIVGDLYGYDIDTPSRRRATTCSRLYVKPRKRRHALRAATRQMDRYALSAHGSGQQRRVGPAAGHRVAVVEPELIRWRAGAAEGRTESGAVEGDEAGAANVVAADIDDLSPARLLVRMGAKAG